MYQEQYHKLENQEPPKAREFRYRGVSYVKPITAAKEAVSVMKLADKLTSGRGLTRHCPLPDHEDKTPSFTLYPETESFFCFGCSRGGDVVDLYRLAKGYDEREAHAAAGHLLLEFGYTPPERPPSRARRHYRQQKIRDLIDEAQLEALARRLWHYVFEPIVKEIEDEHDRKALAKRLWPKIEANARYLLAERRGDTK